MRSHVPVAVLLTSPLLELTAYSGPLPSKSSHTSSRVTQPPRVEPSADSRYRRLDVDEYRMDTFVLDLHLGLEIALFGEGVFAASADLDARRLMMAAVRSIVDIVYNRTNGLGGRKRGGCVLWAPRVVVDARWCELRCVCAVAWCVRDGVLVGECAVGPPCGVAPRHTPGWDKKKAVG